MDYNEFKNFISYIFDKGWSISTINIIIEKNEEDNKEILKRYRSILKNVTTFNEFIKIIDNDDEFELNKNLKVFTSLLNHKIFIGNILYNNNFINYRNINLLNNNIKYIIKNKSVNTDRIINIINNKNSLLSNYINKLNIKINKKKNIDINKIKIKEDNSKIVKYDNDYIKYILKVYINNENVKCYNERIGFPNTILFKFINDIIIINDKIIFPTNRFKSKELLFLELEKIFKIYNKLYLKSININKVLLNVKKENNLEKFIYVANKHKIVCTKKYITIKSVKSKNEFDKYLSIINSTIEKSDNYLNILDKYSNKDLLKFSLENLIEISSILNNEFFKI